MTTCLHCFGRDGVKRLFCLAWLIYSSAALGQDQAQTEFWQTSCADDGRCQATRVLTQSDTGQRFASLIVSFSRDGRRPAMTVATPLGIAVQPGVRVVVKDAFWSLPIEACFPDGCRASRDLTDEEYQLLLSADSADIRFFPYGRQAPLAGEVGLAGLDLAIKGVW